MGEPFLVSVESSNQQSMDTLTAKIDAEVRSGVDGPSRTTLGAIEATMSRIVDSDTEFVVTRPPTIPTMTLLSDISYDATNNIWELQYTTSKSEPTDELNYFRRILYASKGGITAPGDIHNPCIEQNISTINCFVALNNLYTVDDSLGNSNQDDVLTLGDSELTDSIVVGLTDNTESRVQNLVIKIPHSTIRDHIGKKEIVPHPTEGSRVVWSFGIGMVFVGADDAQSNIIMFDTFNLFEISNELVIVSKSNSYSVARHVSFWTQRVVDDPHTADIDESEIVIAKIEYMLESGYTLHKIESTINELDVCTDPRKNEMQTKIDNLNNSACLLTAGLCTTTTYTSETNGVLSLWATVALPIFDYTEHEEVRLSTLLTTLDTNVQPSKTIVSALNFATRQIPQSACSPVAYETFNAIDHTTADLYRGVGVVPESINGYFSVYNSQGESAGTTDSLLTIVLRPKDANAISYMNMFPTEVISLDDLYMSHALPAASLPATIDNQIRTVDQGRSRVLVDNDLLAACPEEKEGSGFVYEVNSDGSNSFECVTTHDWNLDGSVLRPYSTPNGPVFVYSVTDHTEADAKAWLKEYVIGQISDSVDTIAANIYNNSITRVTGDYAAKSKIFWVWPTYYWPDKSPVGLKDRTIISMAWSLTTLAPPSTETPTPPARRLLSMTSQNSEKSEPTKKPILHRRSMQRRVRPGSAHLAQVQAHLLAHENHTSVVPKTLPRKIPNTLPKAIFKTLPTPPSPKTTRARESNMMVLPRTLPIPPSFKTSKTVKETLSQKNSKNRTKNRSKNPSNNLSKVNRKSTRRIFTPEDA